jgi:hypothetical protein
MNALPLPQPPERPRRRRETSLSSDKRQQRRYQVLAIETTIKLGVNLVFSGAAIAALVQLLPYSFAQQEKLKEVQTEVKGMDNRVSKLQKDFDRYFDPSQANAIMQEQTHLADPNQKEIVFAGEPEPSDPTAQVP